ncbi:MAG TPA: response regulator [Negativicutes bacterium]|jgi:two-component system chemotaxis response regulator CheY
MARVLVVDDSMMMRNTLRKILEKAGHVVVGEAVNGEQAIAHYPKWQPDIVTMDITMPGLGGVETIKRLMQSDPAANIVVVSSSGQKHVILDALQFGAKNYIVKPISETNLLPVIDLVLKNKQSPA